VTQGQAHDLQVSHAWRRFITLKAGGCFSFFWKARVLFRVDSESTSHEWSQSCVNCNIPIDLPVAHHTETFKGV